MAGSVKLFQFNQKYYQTFDIYPPESPNQSHRPLTSKNWIVFISLSFFFFPSMGYLFFEKKSMIQFGMIAHAIDTSILCEIFYLISISEIENILEFIENFEQFIEKSKY